MADTTVTPAAMRILRALVGRPPQSMAALIEATGVTRTAVTEQLQDLMAAGFVHRTSQRLGRGRPRYLYTASRRALRELFSTQQRLLAPALLQAVLEVTGPETTQRVLEQVVRVLADHYREKIDAAEPAQRLQQLAGLLDGEGVVVDFVEDESGPVLHERTCPYLDLIDEQRTICGLEVRMFSQVVDSPIELAACRLDESCTTRTFRLSRL